MFSSLEERIKILKQENEESTIKYQPPFDEEIGRRELKPCVF
jgi:hypothetical protein